MINKLMYMALTRERGATRSFRRPEVIPLNVKVEQLSNQNTQEKLGDLDIALLRDLAAHFERMPETILQYHQDHQASRTEAEVIGNCCLNIASTLKSVETKQGLEQLIELVKKFKQKISRYNHNNYKYRWSTGLEDFLVILSRIVEK